MALAHHKKVPKLPATASKTDEPDRPEPGVPLSIRIKSDDNLLELVKKEGDSYRYRYAESLTKKGNTVTFTAGDLQKLIERNN